MDGKTRNDKPHHLIPVKAYFKITTQTHHEPTRKEIIE